MYIYVIFIFLFNYRKVYPWLPRVGDKFYMKGSCYLPCIETNCTGMPDTAFPSFSQSTCCHYLRFCIKQSNSITIMKWFRNRCPIIPLEERVCSKRWLKIHYFASDSFVKGGKKITLFPFDLQNIMHPPFQTIHILITLHLSILIPNMGKLHC